MTNVSRCRACGVQKWQGDSCVAAQCPRNQAAPARRAIRTSAGSRVQTNIINPGVHLTALYDASTGPVRWLGTLTYVADEDGTHYVVGG